jgi:hypothetical protein
VNGLFFLLPLRFLGEEGMLIALKPNHMDELVSQYIV